VYPRPVSPSDRPGPDLENVLIPAGKREEPRVKLAARTKAQWELDLGTGAVRLQRSPS